DNHTVAQYELAGIRAAADAPPPPSRVAMGSRVMLKHPTGAREVEVLGPSAVAAFGGYLYIGYRTSSVVIRVPITPTGDIVKGAAAELIAVFEPWDPQTRRSGDLFDMAFNSRGELFVSMGRAGRIWRLTPDPARPFYGDDRGQRPTS